MRGRKPKPVELKIIEGNPGKRPLNLDAPAPKQAVPACPSFLSPEGKKEWRRVSKELLSVGLLTIVDRAALAGYCQAYSRWKEAEEAIQEHGLTYEYTNKNGSTNVVARPEVSIARECLMLIKAFCAEFGLTPSSRSRLTVPKNEKDEFEDFLGSGAPGCARGA
jgi:P27 family predicted phage terminase small subunit